MDTFSRLENDGSNLSSFFQRMIMDDLCGLFAVADELEQTGDVSRAVEGIRALVGDQSSGLWESALQLHSLTDELLHKDS